jgi:hypothetical protein
MNPQVVWKSSLRGRRRRRDRALKWVNVNSVPTAAN